MQRRRPLTLLEVVIAFMLLGFLLAALIPIYFHAKKEQGCFEQGKEDLLKRLRFYFRVKQLFEMTIPVTSEEEPNHLHFTYDNSTDIDPNYRRKVTSLLYYDKSSQKIRLQTKTQEGIQRNEVLWEKVKKYSLSPLEEKHIFHIVVDDIHFWFRTP